MITNNLNIFGFSILILYLFCIMDIIFVSIMKNRKEIKFRLNRDASQNKYFQSANIKAKKEEML